MKIQDGTSLDGMLSKLFAREQYRANEPHYCPPLNKSRSAPLNHHEIEVGRPVSNRVCQRRWSILYTARSECILGVVVGGS